MKLSNIIALIIGGIITTFLVNLLKSYGQFNIWAFMGGGMIVYLVEIMKKSFRRYL